MGESGQVRHYESVGRRRANGIGWLLALLALVALAARYHPSAREIRVDAEYHPSTGDTDFAFRIHIAGRDATAVIWQDDELVLMGFVPRDTSDRKTEHRYYLTYPQMDRLQRCLWAQDIFHLTVERRDYIDISGSYRIVAKLDELSGQVTVAEPGDTGRLGVVRANRIMQTLLELAPPAEQAEEAQWVAAHSMNKARREWVKMALQDPQSFVTWRELFPVH